MISFVRISTPPFYLNLLDQRLYVDFVKRFLFLSRIHVFHNAQKSQNPNHQFHCEHQDKVSKSSVEPFGYPF